MQKVGVIFIKEEYITLNSFPPFVLYFTPLFLYLMMLINRKIIGNCFLCGQFLRDLHHLLS